MRRATHDAVEREQHDDAEHRDADLVGVLAVDDERRAGDAGQDLAHDSSSGLALPGRPSTQPRPPWRA